MNYNAAEEMKKGVPEQSQCGALFTLIASHVIYSLYLNGDYAVYIMSYFLLIYYYYRYSDFSFILHFLLKLLTLISVKYMYCFEILIPLFRSGILNLLNILLFVFLLL